MTAILAVAACGPPPPTVSDWTPLPSPTGPEVDAVVFLVGDAGEALPGRSPVLAVLQREVEAWSSRLARDSAVSVVFLGDLVYPNGVHERGSPEFPRDSSRLRAQVDVLSGPVARRRGTRGIFLPGNHDWGQTTGAEGVAHLRNLEGLLAAMAEERGLGVGLLPPAGQPGPVALDVGDRLRLVLMDTQWWLRPHEDPWEAPIVRALGQALRTAGRREVIIAAHHPFLSGGPHGGPTPFWKGLGLLYVLRRSGALIQDVNSPPYRALLVGLREIFEESGRPLLWAGGHDHSLQVLEGWSDDQPRWSVVSGAGSKLTGVSGARGMLYGASRPGFMRVTLLENGEAQLHVYAGRDGICEEDGPLLDRCMEEGVAGFHVVWARRLQ
ncbi:MAG: hypothetical protein PVI57_02665 [Gemmatimonadota bacterium]